MASSAASGVQGHCDPVFSKVNELLAANLVSGEELGASICVNIAGKNLVDIWGGYSDTEKMTPWQRDTLVNVWSCSKTVTNLAVLMAVDRGLLRIDDKVSKHWPEFAQNGKQDIEVQHILAHTSGVSGWDKPITLADICNVEKSTAKLAVQAPWWTPGTVSGYHALSQGHLAGELVRRTTGKSLKQFVADEMAGPLSADFQIGAKEDDWPRIATLIPPPMVISGLDTMDPDLPALKTLTGPTPDALFALQQEWREGEIGAANGHGNARSLNRILSAIALGGEIDGVRLLSQKTIDLIFEEQSNCVDVCLGKPVRFGVGFGLPLLEGTPWIPLGRKCFWLGWVSNHPGYAHLL